MLFSFSLEDSFEDINNGINSAISYAIENYFTFNTQEKS
jgi:hypothetical protein